MIDLKDQDKISPPASNPPPPNPGPSGMPPAPTNGSNPITPNHIHINKLFIFVCLF